MSVLTATPTMTTATIPLTLTLLSPLHHGAGTSGNTQMLRTQEITLPDGSSAVVPFVSGSSLRHAIRAAIADLTLTTLGAQPGTLSKPLVDLLYSGGALTSGDGGSDVRLDGHRRLDQLWGAAGLLGYAGRGQIWSGTLYTDFLELVCAENRWRMPDRLLTHPHAQLPAAAQRDEHFGTRHDVTGTHAADWVTADLWGATPTTQMIFDWQVVRAGAVLYGALRLAAATPQHVQALRVGWEWLTASGTLHLGAKRAQGYGLCRVDADFSALPPLDPGVTATLVEHRDEVMALLNEAAGK